MAKKKDGLQWMIEQNRVQTELDERRENINFKSEIPSIDEIRNKYSQKNKIEDELLLDEKKIFSVKSNKRGLPAQIVRNTEGIPFLLGLGWGLFDMGFIAIFVLTSLMGGESNDMADPVLWVILPIFFAIHMFPFWIALIQMFRLISRYSKAEYMVTDKRFVFRQDGEGYENIKIEKITTVSKKKRGLLSAVEIKSTDLGYKHQTVITYPLTPADADILFGYLKELKGTPLSKFSKVVATQIKCSSCGANYESTIGACPFCSYKEKKTTSASRNTVRK